MNVLKALFQCALLASLVGLAVSLIALVRETTAVVSALPASVERQIREQGKETRAAALSAITDTRRELLARVDRVADVSEQALSRMTASIDRVSLTATELRPALENTAKITAQVNDALPLLLDCDHNPDCAYNRYVGVAQATEKAMQAVASTAPGTLRSVESTAGSVASIARSWEKQTPLYIRVLGWVGSGLLKIKTIFF